MRAAGDSTPQDPTPTPDSGSQPPLRIVPKGLRSFDEEDKDFFLELLPGPRDRDGLPDTIRFWKTRIEQTDADATFPVGVMYGPSGCGKSSLVKAGLLPHLADACAAGLRRSHAQRYGAAAAQAAAQARSAIWPAEASLAEALAQLREGRVTDGRKVLLVLDQFEQWLHSTTNMDSSQLVRALRQCDGANVQCLILVRDDFWMSTTRFMQALEIPQLEGTNSAAVDLFDPIACAEGPARLRARLRSTARTRPVGGPAAVPGSRRAGTGPRRQSDLRAALAVCRHDEGPRVDTGEPAGSGRHLRRGRGVPGRDLHGQDRTAHAPLARQGGPGRAQGTAARGRAPTSRARCNRRSDCWSARGMRTRPDDFRDLLQILNSELRLITPTEPEEAEARTNEVQSGPGEHRVLPA